MAPAPVLEHCQDSKRQGSRTPAGKAHLLSCDGVVPSGSGPAGEQGHCLLPHHPRRGRGCQLPKVLV